MSTDDSDNTSGMEDMSQRVREAWANARRVADPPGKLSLAIVTTAWDVYTDLAPAAGYSTNGVPSERQIFLFYALLYFFTHLTLRSASRSGFHEEQLRKLADFIRPRIGASAIVAFFRHWPEEKQAKLQSEFHQNLLHAEIEYTQCDALWSADRPFDSATLVGRLSANAADLWNRSGDLAFASAVSAAGMRAFENMALNMLLQDVLPVIDELDPTGVDGSRL
jgi:hypothetical protein